MNKVPNLRFKEFSEDWKAERAGNIFASITNKKHNGDLLVLSATQDRGVIPRSEIGIDIKYEKENLSSYKKVKYNDFIISLRSFQGGIEHSKYEGLVSPAYTVFNFKNECLFNHNFFAILFKSQNFINRLNTLTYGIRDGKAISFTDFSSMKLTYPEDKEQEKIASFFSLIDKKIELQTEKVEELKNYKKGIMQKIFSQELRFKDENENDYSEWEEKKLGNFIIEYKEKTTTENQYPVLTSSRSGLMFQTDYFKDRQVTTENNIGYHIIPREYITFRSRSDDTTFKFNQNNLIDKGIISYFYPVFCFNESLNNSYSLYFMNNYLGYQIRREIVGTSQLVLSLNKLKELKIPVPCVEEQNKIGKLLDNLEKKILQEQNKLNHFNSYKQGLLQQMFI